MSPLYKHLGKILVRNGQLAGSLNCCCSSSSSSSSCTTLDVSANTQLYTALFEEPGCDPNNVVFDPIPQDPNPDFTTAIQQIVDQLNLNNWQAVAGWGCSCPTDLGNTVTIDCDQQNNEAIVTINPEDCNAQATPCCKYKATLCGFGASAQCCGTLTENMIEYFSDPYSGDFPNPLEINQWNLEVIQEIVEGQAVFLLKATLPECI